MTSTVHTVLGPVPADRLGITAVHEALLAVLPGAHYAYDIDFDRSAIFQTLATALTAFKDAGGGTLVDAGGMFGGRDLPLYEALSRATGVHLVASTGQMEEAMLGGYFLTPQTNPPTPWPAEKFAELYGTEITEGMVVPRVERRAPAGLIATALTATGATPTDESQLRGAARAAKTTRTALSFRAGADPLGELALATGEGLDPSRIVVANAGTAAAEIAGLGAYVVLTDIALATALAHAGHAARVLVATGGAALSFGYPDHAIATASYTGLLAALPADLVHQLLVTNPATLLAVEETTEES